MKKKLTIEQRVGIAAQKILYEKKYISAIDLFVGMNLLDESHMNKWRKGEIPYLEKVIQINLNKISKAMKFLKVYAMSKSLRPSITIYNKRTKGIKKLLRFSKSGNPSIEKAYSTHWISPILNKDNQENLNNS